MEEPDDFVGGRSLQAKGKGGGEEEIKMEMIICLIIDYITLL